MSWVAPVAVVVAAGTAVVRWLQRQVYSGRISLNERWSVDLPFEFVRQVTDNMQQAFRGRGITVLISIRPNPYETQRERMEKYLAVGTAPRCDRLDEESDGLVRSSYRCAEDISQPVATLTTLTFGRFGQVVMSFYMSAEHDLPTCLAMWRSLREHLRADEERFPLLPGWVRIGRNGSADALAKLAPAVADELRRHPHLDCAFEAAPPAGHGPETLTVKQLPFEVGVHFDDELSMRRLIGEMVRLVTTENDGRRAECIEALHARIDGKRAWRFAFALIDQEGDKRLLSYLYESVERTPPVSG